MIKAAKDFFWSTIANVRFKAVMLLVSVFAIVFCFGIALRQFRPADAEPHVEIIGMEMRKSIRNFASVVRTGMFVKNFEVFDISHDRFIIGAVVWFEFNTDEVMPATIEKFSFVNGKILERSPGDVRVTGSRMFIKYDVRVEVKSQLAYHRYPFDDHRISFVLTNNYVTPSELYFTIDNSSFDLADDAFTAHWKVLDRDTSWGYTDLGLDQNDVTKNVQRPVVTFSVNFSKAGIRHLVIIFIPLFIALFFALFTFLMGFHERTSRFRLSVSSLTAILSYRFIIERMMPRVGYFTTTDAIYTLLLLISLCAFIMQIWLGLYNVDDKKLFKSYEQWLQRANDVAFLVINAVLVGGMAYLLIW